MNYSPIETKIKNGTTVYIADIITGKVQECEWDDERKFFLRSALYGMVFADRNNCARFLAQLDSSAILDYQNREEEETN